jgi:hypothetical protein
MLQLLSQVLMAHVAGPARENARLLGELKEKVQEVETIEIKSNETEAAFRVWLVNEITVIHEKIDALRGKPSTIAQISDKATSFIKKPWKK